jgi:hypothetical protein
MKKIFLLSLIVLSTKSKAQNFPWQQPLKMAWSNDGITFNTPTTFQDSAGVPSIIKWKGDTLICAFQWFRAPQGAATWDRVAVKLSYNNGLTWTNPTPIEIVGLPANYQRPFDPTLIKINNDSIRIYYSSSEGLPLQGLDSTVNTYSAKSGDGIHYIFENNPRVNEPLNRVIDPAVVFFNNAYHYASPIGSPQQGAYHYVSPNGINFNKVQDIPSDASHNWTGNYMENETNELRFYGAGGQGIWFNTSPNGGMWDGYTNTNLQGGDPTALKISNNNYLIIFVGAPYFAGIEDNLTLNKLYTIYPNPTQNKIYLTTNKIGIGSYYNIYNLFGQHVLSGYIHQFPGSIDLESLTNGMYMLSIDGSHRQLFQVIK